MNFTWCYAVEKFFLSALKEVQATVVIGWPLPPLLHALLHSLACLRERRTKFLRSSVADVLKLP